ncbi:MAG: glycosyltransferase [Bacteroidaceae bacterium]|nr:glycosyltransferase [Bacteroidaceae bacterium]
MKVLWLTNTHGLFRSASKSNGGYNGGGWESSLQRLFCGRGDVQLAVAFVSESITERKIEEDDIVYYPIYSKPLTAWQKLRRYYGGYKHVDKTAHHSRLQEIIADFEPDIIHIHGIENQLANILLLDGLNIPTIVSLQGLLLPYANTFFPEGFNLSSFQRPFSINEHILRNGYRFAYRSMQVRAEHERLLWQKVQNVFGRTAWDKVVAAVYAPKAKYYHGGEVMRPSFYENVGRHAAKTPTGTIRLCSTISNTVYKGLDVIMKTARELSLLGIDYEWKVVGIINSCRIIKYFQRQLGIDISRLNIRFCGVKTAEELVEELLQSDIFVHPSYIDNSPNSVSEAQMVGCPVIAHNTGGLPSLIEHGKTGFLVPTNSVAEIVYYIKQLAETQGLSQSISRAATAAALHRHDKTAIINEVIAAYKKIINN